ncbi:MAG: MarR family transcriptional regulator [Chloroflexi bacterium]|nr:MarR family transcriptional regulator [Chloroflexota bacterium]MCI0575683.1 MarR family transcriptional regulator [Chloroflexota bacterium]MCI0647814.1 MarR family transcriptional regulator [Chloroflexota bacterium]
MAEEAIKGTIGYLIVQVCKMHRNKTADLLADIELYVGQEMFLLELWQQDGLTQSEIAGDLCVQPATVTRMLDRMEKAGLVERQKDMEDQRVSRVYLTETGRTLQEPVREMWQRLEQQTLANFTLEERLLLRRFLLQLQENLS